MVLQNGHTESRFEVLPGDVPLRQREELLETAAQPGEQVTVPVTDERQAIILEVGAEAVLSFNNFLLEASTLLPGGDPPDNLTISLSRQLLNQSGMLLPNTTEELSPVEGRVSVSIDRESGQYFVDIADTVVNDSGVYTMEVCSQRGNTTGSLCECLCHSLCARL